MAGKAKFLVIAVLCFLTVGSADCGKPANQQAPEVRQSAWNKISEPTPLKSSATALVTPTSDKKIAVQASMAVSTLTVPLIQSGNSNSQTSQLAFIQGDASTSSTGGASVFSASPFSRTAENPPAAAVNLPATIALANPTVAQTSNLSLPNNAVSLGGGSIVQRSSVPSTTTLSPGSTAVANTVAANPANLPSTPSNVASSFSGQVSSPQLINTRSGNITPLGDSNAAPQFSIRSGTTTNATVPGTDTTSFAMTAAPPSGGAPPVPIVPFSAPPPGNPPAPLVFSTPAQPITIANGGNPPQAKIVLPGGIPTVPAAPTTLALPPPDQSGGGGNSKPPDNALPGDTSSSDSGTGPTYSIASVPGAQPVGAPGPGRGFIHGSDGAFPGFEGDNDGPRFAAITPQQVGGPGPGQSLLEDGEDEKKSYVGVKVTASPTNPSVADVIGRGWHKTIGGNLEGWVVTVVDPGKHRFIQTKLRYINHQYYSESVFAFSWDASTMSWDPPTHLPLTWNFFLSPPITGALNPSPMECIPSDPLCPPQGAQEDAKMEPVTFEMMTDMTPIAVTEHSVTYSATPTMDKRNINDILALMAGNQTTTVNAATTIDSNAFITTLDSPLKTVNSASTLSILSNVAVPVEPTTPLTTWSILSKTTPLLLD